MGLIFKQPPQRILIIKPSAIGDVVHALPVLNLLRRTWPDAHIAWLVTPLCSGLLEGHPQLDEIILFERKRLGRWWRDRSAADTFFSFIKTLGSKRFDLVIDLQGLLRSGWLALLTRSPYRIGHRRTREPASIFYTHRVSAGPVQQHAVDRYLRIAKHIGCDGPVTFNFAHDDNDRAFVRNLVDQQSKYAVVLPGTNWQTKRWPVEQFASLAGLIEKRLGLPVVVAGGPQDSELAKQIPHAHDLTGRTTLRQLSALLESASVVIANDSGPMHIASALGRPLVTLFGPTNPTQTGPYGRLDTVLRVDLPCSPCYSRRCSHQSCMRWLAVESAYRAVEQAIQYR